MTAESSKNLTEWLIRQGKPLTLSPHQEIILQNAENNTFYWLEKGDVDLFWHVEEEAANSKELWKFLFNTEKWGFIFPFRALPNKVKLIIKSNEPAIVRQLSAQNFLTYLTTLPEGLKVFNQLVEGWCEDILEPISSNRRIQATHHLSLEGSVELKPNETLSILRQDHENVSWTSLKGGNSLLFGIAPLSSKTEKELFPLYPGIWLKCGNKPVIATKKDIDLRKDVEECWLGLLTFNDLAAQIISYDLHEKDVKEERSILFTVNRNEQIIQETMEKIGDVLSLSPKAKVSTVGSPLLNACNLIGRKIEKVFISPFSSKAATFQDQIYTMAMASNVYYRQVMLGSGWWKKDHGPLLGIFENQKSTPIGLIPEKTDGYLQVDPVTGSQSRVNAQLSQNISSSAWMFYRSFSAKAILGYKEILAFCTFGRLVDYGMIILSSLFATLLGLLIPFGSKLLFDEVIPYIDKSLFAQIIMMIGVVTLSSIFVFVAREYTVLRVENILNHDVDTALWQRILSLPMKFFKRFPAGDLIQRLSSVREIRKALSMQMVRSILNMLFTVVFLIVMIYFSPILTLAGMIVVIIGLLPVIAALIISRRWSTKYQETQGRITSKVIEMIFGLSKIRTNGAEHRIFASWAQDAAEAQSLRLKIGNAGVAVRVWNGTIEVVKYLVIFAVVMSLLNLSESNGGQNRFTLTIGDFIAFSSAFASFSSTLTDFVYVLLDFVLLKPLWDRTKIFLKEPPETGEEKIAPEVIKGGIRVEQLSFRYDLKSPLIYDGISLNILPGEFVALAGPSGCGKSTLLRLILGFENPEQGAIFIDGINLSTLDLRSMRRQMGVVLQNSSIIDGSIRDNIAGGAIYTAEEIDKAVKAADMEEDIKNLPMGLNTFVSSGGSALSGGQRQRILIARAFLQNPAVMIWDEATSFLDNESQARIMKNLEQLDSTRIVIAHRVNTLQNANRIYVINDGKIVDSGTYHDLATRSPNFQELLAENNPS